MLRKLSFSNLIYNARFDLQVGYEYECRAPARQDGSLQSGRSPTFMIAWRQNVSASA